MRKQCVGVEPPPGEPHALREGPGSMTWQTISWRFDGIGRRGQVAPLLSRSSDIVWSDVHD